MEKQSEPVLPLPEPGQQGPGFIGFARGMATFTLAYAVFTMAQMCLLIERVLHLDPAYAERSFSMGLLEEPAFQEAWRTYSRQGDVVAHIALWSGVAGLLVLLWAVRGWKARGMGAFLGMVRPPRRSLLWWTLGFLGFIAVMEVLARWLPELQSDFMASVLATVTNYPVLVLGVVVVSAVFEEFLFRGVLFGSLRHIVDKHVAVAISAGIFTLVHPQYSMLLQLVYVLPMAVFLGYARANSGSIWVCVALHALNNGLSVVLPQG